MAKGIELPDPEPFIHRNWLFQRVGWAAMLLLVVAGLVGALGRGPLARSVLQTGGLRVEWDRVTRHGATSRIEVTLDEASLPDGANVQLFIDDALLEVVDIERVLPPPRQVVAMGDRLVSSVEIRRPPARLHLSVRPHRLGLHRGTLGVVGGPEVGLSLLTLP